MLPILWFFSLLFSSLSSLSSHHLNIPIENVANLSLISSFIPLTDDISNHKKVRFAVSTHENTIFLGCACVQSAYVYHRKSLNDPWEVQQHFTPLTTDENDFGLDVSVNVNPYQPHLRLALVGSPSYNNDTGTKCFNQERSYYPFANDRLLLRRGVYLSRNIFRELVSSPCHKPW